MARLLIGLLFLGWKFANLVHGGLGHFKLSEIVLKPSMVFILGTSGDKGSPGRVRAVPPTRSPLRSTKQRSLVVLD
jgi:hypothetical protein